MLVDVKSVQAYPTGCQPVCIPIKADLTAMIQPSDPRAKNGCPCFYYWQDLDPTLYFISPKFGQYCPRIMSSITTIK